MYYIIVSCLAVAVVAYTIAMATIDTAPRYFSMMLLPSVCSKFSVNTVLDICRYQD